MKKFISKILFRVYLFLNRYDNVKTEKYRVYDSLGLIDTLGYTTEQGKFTKTYSDELQFIYSIRFFYWWIECIDYCGSEEIKITKN